MCSAIKSESFNSSADDLKLIATLAVQALTIENKEEIC